ncbi:BatD family protein [Psychromonas sp. GE-S-Ul-11]|uniref:BatD family protein n=1 Tax=Psychromonas sp. GE-S-Ul-11 TaxID=3241170 RepID=UPI00390CCC1F
MPFIQKFLHISLLFIALCMPAVAATQATASISSNTIYLGDTFYLTVQVDDTGSDYQLDTSQLSNDFNVGSPSRSQQTSYINGNFTQQTTWTVSLRAKSVGKFTIPALTLGDLTTQAIQIEVKQPGKQQQSTSSDTIFIENSINKNSVYIDQPVIIDTKIFVAENVANGDIQPPSLSDASIEPLDVDQQQNQVIRNGLRYRVFHYQYKVTPSVAGDVSIISPLLTGSVQQVTRVNGWQDRVKTTPINIRGNNLPLTVKAMPAGFKGDWLISEDVRLIENNDLQAEEHFVGEPITRSISLQVASIALDKMPEIDLNYDKALRVYPDQDDLKQGTIDGLIYSQRTVTHAIIANKPGKLVLPEIKVAWWNSKTEKQEYATLPAQTLTINPAPQSANQSNNSSANSSVQSHQDFSALPATPNSAATNNQTSEEQTTQLLYWQISTLVLLLLLILLSFYHVRSTHNLTVAPKVPKKTKQSTPYKALLAALKEAKPSQVYLALLQYGQVQQPNMNKLAQLCEVDGLDSDLKQQLLINLQQLEQACSGKAHHWDAQQLLKLIKMHHQVTAMSDPSQITNLNP